MTIYLSNYYAMEIESTLMLGTPHTWFDLARAGLKDVRSLMC